MKQICRLLPGIVLLVGCSTEKHAAVQPASPPLATPVAFPAPNESQSNQLARLDTLLRSSIANLNLSWVSDMGAVAVPACLREADEETLPDGSRDLAFLVLGNALRNAGVRENPAAPNDLVVPTLLRGLADPNPRIQCSAAFAARYVDDVRLVPALRQLLGARDFVQEQSVLALGTSGREAEVLPIAKLFFETSNGKFRFSCLSALNTVFLRHNVNVARVLRQNEDDFAKYHLQNVWSVENRFDEFQVIGTVFRGLYSPKESTRHDANEKLRKLTGREARFDPAGDDAARARGIEEWEGYILQDYWGEPPPKS